MSKIVGMDGKPHVDNSNQTFPAWAQRVEQHMQEVNLLFDELITAHNRVADRVVKLEASQRNNKKRWQFLRRK